MISTFSEIFLEVFFIWKRFISLMGKQTSSKDRSNSVNSTDPNQDEPSTEVTTTEWPSWYNSKERKRRRNSNEDTANVSSTSAA